MRTHFLKDLAIQGKEKAAEMLQGFDFYKLQRIIRVTWESQRDENNQLASCVLEITTAYDDGSAEKAEVTLRFVGVTRCRLPELVPFIFLSEIEVEDVANAQLEGVRYLIKNYGSTELEIECRNCELLTFRRSQLTD